MTDCPAAVTVAGATDFFTVSDGFEVAVNVALDSVVLTGPPAGLWPAASAVLVTEPASTSACVAVYVAVQVTLSPGASVPMAGGQVIEDRIPVPLKLSSVIDVPVTVTLPVLVTTKEKVTPWPAAVTAVGATVCLMVSAGAAVAVTFAVDGGEVSVVPDGSVALAVAVLVIVPASTSACVVV